MEALTDAVNQGGMDLVRIWGPPGFLLILSIIGNVFQWLQDNKRDAEHRKEVKDLNAQINTEIKAGITMAQEYRKTFETHADNLEKLLESRRGRQ